MTNENFCINRWQRREEKKKVNKILITGCGGMLGEAIYNEFKEDFNVLATDIDLNEKWLSYLDVRNFNKVEYLIKEYKPDLIIECGTDRGGSALYFAHLFDIIGNGKVVTIDIDNKNPPQHDRIKYLIGSSTSDEVVNEVEKLIEDKRVMIILDSDHDKRNVLKELNIYNKMVSKGCYLVVEDSNINGHPVHKNFGAGPMEAIEKFMKYNKDFEIDKNKEKFLLTSNPKGYLRRK